MKSIIIVLSIFLLFNCVNNINHLNKNVDVKENSIFIGSNIIHAEDNGVFFLMHDNKHFLFRDAGYEFAIDNIPYTMNDSLSTTVKIVDDNVIVESFFNDLFTLSYSLRFENDQIIISVVNNLKKDFDYFNFVFHIDNYDLLGKEYITASHKSIYPIELENTYLESDINYLSIHNNSFTIESEAPFQLVDARGWEAERIIVLFDLKNINDQFDIKLSLPVSDYDNSDREIYNLRYSQQGYTTNSYKRVFLEWPKDLPIVNEKIFIYNSNDKIIEEGFFTNIEDKWQFSYAYFDFSDIETEGIYYFKWQSKKYPFRVTNELYSDIWQDALNIYLPWQMCHAEVNFNNSTPSHDICHNDDGINVLAGTQMIDGFYSVDDQFSGYDKGEQIISNIGGWHDAGDHDLNTAAQAFTIHHLALAYEEFSIDSDLNRLDIDRRIFISGEPDGIPDILQQIAWGSLWLLNMQQSDGRFFPGIVAQKDIYLKHLSPENTTDGIMGTGDERNIYTDYQTAEHLKAVIALVSSARVLVEYFPELANKCLEAAELGYAYYESNEPSYHIQTSFHIDDQSLSGEIQSELSALCELFITTGNEYYYYKILNYKYIIPTLDQSYPSPHITERSNYIYAGIFLARLYKISNDIELNSSIIKFIEVSIQNKKYFLNMENWPYEFMVNKWYGQSGLPIRLVVENYYFSKVIENDELIKDTQFLFSWVLGAHPFDNNVYILGINQNHAKYMFSKQFVELYGDEPGFVAGGVTPGLCLEGNRVFFNNSQFSFKNNEPVIDISASLIFAAHALDQEFNK